MTDDEVAVSRAAMVIVGLISLYFAIYSSTTLVSLLLKAMRASRSFSPAWSWVSSGGA